MTDLQKIQEIDIQILKDVVSVLKKYNLKYYMIGGTLLGAVRHQGFIPWDDDMDIAMPRGDYEIFLDQFGEELPNNLRLKNFKLDKQYKYYITRVSNMNYKVKELRNQTKAESTNISIDIFPIDGTPNNKILRMIYFFRIMFYRALISLVQKDNIDLERKRNFFEKTLIFFGTHINLKKILSANKLQYKIDKMLKAQSANSAYAGTIMGAYRTREIVPRDFFGAGKYFQFGNEYFCGPSKYDAYLKHMYGNYMKLPSKEQRESKRHFTIIKNKQV